MEGLELIKAQVIYTIKYKGEYCRLNRNGHIINTKTKKSPNGIPAHELRKVENFIREKTYHRIYSDYLEEQEK